MFLILKGRLAHAAWIALIISLMSAAAHGWTPAVASQPVLDWEPRSDWVSSACSERWCSHAMQFFSRALLSGRCSYSAFLSTHARHRCTCSEALARRVAACVCACVLGSWEEPKHVSLFQFLTFNRASAASRCHAQRTCRDKPLLSAWVRHEEPSQLTLRILKRVG
jgi:hypothetical protein